MDTLFTNDESYACRLPAILKTETAQGINRI